MTAEGGAPTFDANGQVRGRLELFVGGEWVTVYGNLEYFGDEEAKVGCHQLGNELGYTPVSWITVPFGDTTAGIGKQYYARDCDGDENELSSCGVYEEKIPPSHQYDTGLSCVYEIAGDECEECPQGKFR